VSQWALASSLDATDASQDVNLDIRGSISTQTDIILQFACSLTLMIDELAVLQRHPVLPRPPRCISPASLTLIYFKSILFCDVSKLCFSL